MYTVASMRLIKKGIAHRNGEGFVRLQADEAEDMYHLFNLICEGDIIGAETIRNVSLHTFLYVGSEFQTFGIQLSTRIYSTCNFLIPSFHRIRQRNSEMNVDLSCYFNVSLFP